MKRPRITRAVLDGIIAATSSTLAGEHDVQTYGQRHYDVIERADEWAREMRAWMDEAPKRREKQRKQ